MFLHMMEKLSYPAEALVADTDMLCPLFTELRKEQIFSPFGRDSAHDDYVPSLSTKKLDLPQMKISYTPSMDILVCVFFFI